MKIYASIIMLAGLSLTACADNSPGGKAVQARHDHFEQVSKAFKHINDQLKEDAPDLAAVRADAGTIACLAPQLKSWFPSGSGPQDGKRTDAKADVWTKPAEFEQASTRFANAADALKTAAATSNTATIAASAKALGSTCKSCHEKFRD